MPVLVLVTQCHLQIMMNILSDFAIMHEDDYVGPESVGLYGKVFPETSYRISGWTYVGTQDSFGERSYTSIKEGITEESMFRLRHAPLSN